MSIDPKDLNVVPLKSQARSYNDMLIDRVKGVPATPATAEDMAHPSNPNVYHHPEAGAPSREAIKRSILDNLRVGYDHIADAPVLHDLDKTADAILALFPAPPDKAVLGGMGERGNTKADLVSLLCRVPALIKDDDFTIQDAGELADQIIALLS